MVLINLTGEELVSAIDKQEELCCYCDKPFKHYMKQKKSKENGLCEMEMIMGHPACKKTYTKMQNIKKKITKTKKTLHDLRTAQLNLEFEAFLSGQATIDQDTDEIFLLLKQKGIMPDK